MDARLSHRLSYPPATNSYTDPTYLYGLLLALVCDRGENESPKQPQDLPSHAHSTLRDFRAAHGLESGDPAMETNEAVPSR
eukprot:6182005-Pleurochrysis_carterae.AAC.1